MCQSEFKELISIPRLVLVIDSLLSTYHIKDNFITDQRNCRFNFLEDLFSSFFSTKEMQNMKIASTDVMLKET